MSNEILEHITGIMGSPGSSNGGSEGISSDVDDDVNVTDVDSGSAEPGGDRGQIQGVARHELANSSENRITLREAIRDWVMAEENIPEDAITRLLKSLRRFDSSLPATAAALFPMRDVKFENSGANTAGSYNPEVMLRLDAHTVRLDQIAGDVHNVNQKMNLILAQMHSVDERLGLFSPAVSGDDNTNLNSRALKRPVYIPRRCSTLEDLDEWLKQEPHIIARQVSSPTLRATVRKFIKLCMTRDLALKFSWTGLGEKRKPQMKICFRDSQVFSYMLSVLQHTVFAEAQFQQIADAVKVVLSGVVDWDGGRKRRTEEVIVSTIREGLHELVQNGADKEMKSPVK